MNRSSYFLIKVVSDLKLGHFYFLWLCLPSATLEVKWKTSNFIVDFDLEKREDFGVPLSESINFDYFKIPYPAVQCNLSFFWGGGGGH